ncbi:EEFSEC, partial [Symbiodinium sp. CCMP2456]
AVRASEAAAQLRQREEARKVLLECRDLQDQIEGLRGQHRAFRAAEAAVAQATKESEVPTPAAPVVHISRDQLEQTFRVEHDHLEARANAAASAAWVEELRRWGRELEYWRSRSQQLLSQAPSPAATVEIRAAEEECSHAQAKAEAVESAVLRSHETRSQGWRTQKPSTARGARGAAGRGTPAKPAPGKGGYSPLHLLRSVLKVEEQFSVIESETEEVAAQVAQTIQAQSEMEQHTALKAELTELKEHSEQLEACEAALQDELVGDFSGELRKEALNVNLGVLGHIDSGKTSICKMLSTVTSTASMDKSRESQERGITLDLGFSSFSTDAPEHIQSAGFDSIQWCLVDCPGHASLIRTVIGGAQIIDLCALVIDVNKGIQTQTAECMVVAEILANQLVVILNKIDMIPAEKRKKVLDKVVKELRKTFQRTKFGSDLPFACVSAHPQ